jgi:hypothetical protein
MEIKTFKRFSRETSSFFALIIANIVGAGLAMSYAVTTGVNNLTLLVNARRILLLQTALSGIALLGFIFAIRWLIFSAQILSGFDDLRDKFKKCSEKSDSEAITELVIQNMAFYRDNKPAIEKLALGSRATGIFFLLLGSIAIFNLFTMRPTDLANLLMLTSGTFLCIALGIVGVYSPSFFKKYSKIWEQRLQDSFEIENRLREILEGN